MKVNFLHRKLNYSFDLSKGLDISIPVKRTNSVSSFNIDGADYKFYADGNFVGSVLRGAGCNLETVTFTAHGNGTHTECVGHISNEVYRVNDLIQDQFMTCCLVTVGIIRIDEDEVLDFRHFNFDILKDFKAIVIRTTPNPEDKKFKDYSGQNSPYILREDMKKIVVAGVEHLLVDLPSVDKEWDNGELLSHHVFWNYPDKPRTQASITEFIYVEDQITDGFYMLKLNISGFESDAAPSKPILYPLAPNK